MSVEQRDRLRRLAAERSATMVDTLDAALDSLRRDQFFRAMADAEGSLRAQPDEWEQYVTERDVWLNAELG